MHRLAAFALGMSALAGAAAISLVVPEGLEPAALAQARADAKPVVTTSFSSGGIAPRSLAEAIAEVDAVLRIRVLSDGRPVLPPQPTRRSFVATSYAVQVLEVLLAHPLAAPVGAQMAISQGGGEADLGDFVLRTTGGGPQVLSGGWEFLVFTSYNQRDNRFTTSPWNAHPIHDGRLGPQGDAPSRAWPVVRDALYGRTMSEVRPDLLEAIELATRPDGPPGAPRVEEPPPPSR